MDEILSTAQVADAYGCFTPDGLRWMRHVGKGPQHFKVGRKVYYRRSVVEQWITDREAESVLGV